MLEEPSGDEALDLPASPEGGEGRRLLDREEGGRLRRGIYSIPVEFCIPVPDLAEGADEDFVQAVLLEHTSVKMSFQRCALSIYIFSLPPSAFFRPHWSLSEAFSSS